MEFKDIKSSRDLKNHLNSPFSNTHIKYFFHYTTIENLYKIYKNKTLCFSKMSVMNDLMEKDFASGCDDYFFCLSCGYEAEYENFGMWSMYGNLGNRLSNNVEKGVKIQFSRAILEIIKNESNINLKFHNVAYKNLKFNSQESIISLGKENNKKISFNSEILKGYIKDSAWQYEKEARFRIENMNNKDSHFILPVSENILKELIIYPSPELSVEEANDIFKGLCEERGYPSVLPDLEQNYYEKTYQSKQRNGDQK